MERFEIYTENLKEFVRRRGWDAYQNPKDLAMAMAVECAEVMEIFQWLTPSQSTMLASDPSQKESVAHEIADVLNYLVRLAWSLDIDILDAVNSKLAINCERFPELQKEDPNKRYIDTDKSDNHNENEIK